MDYVKEFMKALEKGKLFLFEPTKAFTAERETSFGDAFRYVMLLAIVSSVLSGIIAAPFVGVWAISTMVTTYIMLILGAVVGGLILHIFAYIFGAKKGLDQTLKTVCFGSTPTLLFLWIPVVGFVISLYGIVLNVIGLKSLQGMPTGKAVLAVLTPLIIAAIVAVILFLVFLALFLALVGFDPTAMSGAFSAFSV